MNTNFIKCRDLKKLIRQYKIEGIKVITKYNNYGYLEGYIIDGILYSRYNSLEYKVIKL